jgi:hypothetical protein
MTPAALRCYMLSDDDDGTGYAIVARTSAEAKMLGRKNRECSDLDWGEWVLVKVRWLRHVDVSDLEAGHVLGSVEGLEREAYSYAWGTCPVCGAEDVELSMDERVACSACHAARDADEDKGDAQDPHDGWCST